MLDLCRRDFKLESLTLLMYKKVDVNCRLIDGTSVIGRAIRSCYRAQYLEHYEESKTQEEKEAFNREYLEQTKVIKYDDGNFE